MTTKNYNSPAAAYKPAHGGYPNNGVAFLEAGRNLVTKMRELKDQMDDTSIPPQTTCACGQVPVCHGLRFCGKENK